MKRRYNQSFVFYDNLIILIRGKNNKGKNDIIPIEAYDNEKNKVWEFPGIGMVRQSSFILDNYLFFMVVFLEIIKFNQFVFYLKLIWKGYLKTIII